jgi:hypothetical protein
LLFFSINDDMLVHHGCGHIGMAHTLHALDPITPLGAEKWQLHNNGEACAM